MPSPGMAAILWVRIRRSSSHKGPAASRRADPYASCPIECFLASRLKLASTAHWRHRLRISHGALPANRPAADKYRYFDEEAERRAEALARAVLYTPPRPFKHAPRTTPESKRKAGNGVLPVSSYSSQP